MATMTSKLIWIINAPKNPEETPPSSVEPFGQPIHVFRARESASHHPEEALARLVTRLQRDWQPDHAIAWMGGDTLAAILTGVALERLALNQFTWLRYIGRQDYQPIPVNLNVLSHNLTDQD
jgi:hypothetical protein